MICIALAAATLAGSVARAQAPTLVSPLSDAEKTVVRAKHEEGLRQQLYFAKRHRIVRVNTDLLYPRTDAHASVTIDLFDDAAFTYAVSNVRSSNGGNSFAWEGTLENPRYSTADIRKFHPDISPEFAALLHQTEFGIRIGGALHVYDKSRNRFWPASRFNRHYTGHDGSHIRPGEPDPDASRVYAIAFSIVDPTTNSTYRVEALNDDPGFHLIMELAPEKVFTLPLDNVTGDTGKEDAISSSENEAKRRAYEEFRRSLTDESEARKQAEIEDFFDYMKSLRDKGTFRGN